MTGYSVQTVFGNKLYQREYSSFEEAEKAYENAANNDEISLARLLRPDGDVIRTTAPDAR